VFISVEGIEGSGKTSQIAHIRGFFEQRNIPYVITKEPGATPIGKKVRAILLDPENRHMAPVTELLLYMADRVQHVTEIIRPALESGKTVLCDRFYDATVVYQGFARGVDLKTIQSLHAALLKGIQPDVTVLLDLPPEQGLARAWKQIDSGSRTPLETRFERETIHFHEKVRSGYLKLAGETPERFRIINAGETEAEVKEKILKTLSLLYPD
jgi:dTMP kinase